MPATDTHAQVQDYYGIQLQSSQDLLTDACCTDDIPLAHHRILAQLAREVLEKYYGCGVCVPDAIEGCTVLDLGSGRDARGFASRRPARQQRGPRGEQLRAQPEHQ